MNIIIQLFVMSATSMFFAFPDCFMVTTSFLYYLLLIRPWLGMGESQLFMLIAVFQVDI